MSAAPSWPLISSPVGANLPKRDWHRPRVEFRHIPNSEARCQVFILRPNVATFRTQNDVRSRSTASPVSTIRLTDRKSPKFAYLPTAYAETLPSPPPNRAFVLPPRYGMAIVEIRGVSRRIPTQSCVQRTRVTPVMAGLAPAI